MKLADIQIKKILYATDLSETAVHAFSYAVSLANMYGAGITILHVLTEFPAEERLNGADQEQEVGGGATGDLAGDATNDNRSDEQAQDRGYECIEEKLELLGANIKRVPDRNAA